MCSKPTVAPPTPTPVSFLSSSCRDGVEDGDSQGDGSSQPDTISIASRTSQNTVESDKVRQSLPSFPLPQVVVALTGPGELCSNLDHSGSKQQQSAISQLQGGRDRAGLGQTHSISSEKG